MWLNFIGDHSKKGSSWITGTSLTLSTTKWGTYLGTLVVPFLLIYPLHASRSYKPNKNPQKKSFNTLECTSITPLVLRLVKIKRLSHPQMCHIDLFYNGVDSLRLHMLHVRFIFLLEHNVTTYLTGFSILLNLWMQMSCIEKVQVINDILPRPQKKDRKE